MADTKSSKSSRKSTKKKRSTKTQNAGQPSGPSKGGSKTKRAKPQSAAEGGKQKPREGQSSTCCCCCSRKPNESLCTKLMSMLGFGGKRKRTDDLIMFGENASMESSLLWSEDGTQPTSDDYLEFVPEHERSLSEFATKVALPKPQEDRTDY
mmetsp:Transcript_21682/g.35249  ORF Transcript_21682/g.35249 Transcript_21682/m.35249 type:complete len:152 (+) Transcript_21682:108-563(+)|eukprot:CAMPEP_0196141382 /NCGR_PEP_ID=MMETSP0910-20130528/9537_1 /TAXON_ID=49265 /ORGANISM="Thalassiosira rotula, Strain GSO102" /LENGTH=151 /DNA_ID=CAMNT_0041402531 /DNA_START=115 /DNA_END=570 /DNA_ORIENTATION=-